MLFFFKVSPTSKNIWGSPSKESHIPMAMPVNNLQSLFDFAKASSASIHRQVVIIYFKVTKVLMCVFLFITIKTFKSYKSFFCLWNHNSGCSCIFPFRVFWLGSSTSDVYFTMSLHMNNSDSRNYFLIQCKQYNIIKHYIFRNYRCVTTADALTNFTYTSFSVRGHQPNIHIDNCWKQ